MFEPFQHPMCFYSDELGLRSSKMTSEFIESYNGTISDRNKISYILDKNFSNFVIGDHSGFCL